MNIKHQFTYTKQTLALLILAVTALNLHACARHKGGSKLVRSDGRDTAHSNQRASRSTPSNEQSRSTNDRDAIDTQSARYDAIRSISEREPITEQSSYPSEQNAPALPALLFSYDSAQLSEQSRRALGAYARWLSANGHRIRISGHTDERGTREYNLALGRLRAQSALNFMISQGVPSRRIEAVSYGEESPVARGSTESAWRQNRRVEISLL